MEVKEFEIPVPWGHVAVKAWGNEADTPVLTIHGLGDNAGSFDRLLPFLPASFYYICIDLPSHGKSSPYPPHLLISAVDNLLTFKLIVNYLNREKYILMGHSWGGQATVLFTQLYPEHVLKLIVLDSFYLSPVSVYNFKDHLTGKFEALTRIEENISRKKQPMYTYAEAVTKLRDSRLWGELYKEAAEALVKRSLIPAEGGKFYFSTDPRLKAFINPLFDLDFIVKFARKCPITCPVLFVPSEKNQLAFFRPFVEELQKYNKSCVIRRVTGSHDVHNNNPDLVGPIVSSFLLNMKSKMQVVFVNQRCIYCSKYNMVLKMRALIL